MNPFVLLKTSATRAVKEWQQAQQAVAAGGAAAGDAKAYQDQIAAGYGQLGLRPRQLRDVSLGGEEAAVDLMMGQAPKGKMDDTGYVIRKMYKPDSGLHQGDVTRNVLQMKQDFVDKARADPGMRRHMVDMAGFEEIPGVNPRDKSHFISYHQNVPGVKDFDINHPQALDRLKEVHQNLIEPMARQGQEVGDTVIAATDAQRRMGMPPLMVNPGNVAMVDEGGHQVPKVIDFIPGQRTAGGGMSNPAREFEKKHVKAPSPFKAMKDPGILMDPTEYGYTKYREGKGHSVDDVRKAVYQGRGPKARAAVEAVEDVAEAAPGVFKRVGRAMGRHPVATGAAALGTLGALGAGGYALHKHLKGKSEESEPKKKSASADPFFSAFFDEMGKLSGVEHIVPGALWGAGSGAVGGVLGDVSHPITGASYGALTGGVLGGAMSGVLGPGSIDRVVGVPMIAGSTASAIAGVKREQRARKLGRELYG